MKAFWRPRAQRPQFQFRHDDSRSVHEILALQEFCEQDLMTNVYFYAEELVLVAPIHEYRSMPMELTTPVILQEPVSDEQLGLIAMNGLLAFKIAESPPPAVRGRSDWATYQASGAKSLTAFEKTTIEVRVRAIKSTLRLEAYPLHCSWESFAIRSDAPPSIAHEDLGQRLRELVAAVKVLQVAGVV